MVLVITNNPERCKKELKATYWVRHSSYTRQWRAMGAVNTLIKEGKFSKSYNRDSEETEQDIWYVYICKEGK